MTHLHPHRSDDDEIFQKYLDRAIADINALATDIASCELCAHRESFTPVLGTGHPLADIFLLKYRASGPEVKEGVAFYGQAGEVVLRSVRRLNIDPLDIYGTNCVKCLDIADECAGERCPQWLARELQIVDPKLVVVMGDQSVHAINSLQLPDARALRAEYGEVQQLSATCSALVCPDIDESLTRPGSKQQFWDAFRVLGEWYAAQPPY